MNRRKAISTVVGILILLIFIIMIAIPLSTVFLTQPTLQNQQTENVQPYKLIAQEQYNDFAPSIPEFNGNSEPQIEFLYSGNYSVFFVFNSNSTLVHPLIVQYIMIYNGSNWVLFNITKINNIYVAEQTKQIPSNGITITITNVNSQYDGKPAIEIILPVFPYENEPQYIAIVTQYGNIIYG